MEIQTENSKVKAVFFGAGNFAVKILEGILTFDFLQIVGVVTQPDKPAGRDKRLAPCHVKEWLNNNPQEGVKIFAPEKLRLEAEQILSETSPDLVIVADYGQMIPESIINFPRYKCLNVHGSLLPDLRGAVPATMAILRGYTKTGVSIPIMTKGLDDGDIIASQELSILPTDNTLSLRMRLAEIAIPLLKEVLPKWFKGEISPTPQDHSKATITWEKDIEKDKAKITKDTLALDAEKMIRAFSPWPIAWCEAVINGKTKRIKIFKAELSNKFDDEVGKFLKFNGILFLNFSDASILVKKLQLEGKKIIDGKEGLFLKGLTIN